jgi:hypothetical protein
MPIVDPNPLEAPQPQKSESRHLSGSTNSTEPFGVQKRQLMTVARLT